MAETQAFETDFWKDANLRKVWDEIVPGEPRKTIPYTRNPPGLFRRGLCQNHAVGRADRAALDPYPPDVFLHAGRRLDALAGHGQCRAVLEL
jgi:hypothetical protein